MTEEEEAQISMYMRVVEFFRKNSDIVNTNEEMKKTVAQLKGLVQQIFEILSEEDHDRLLERYNEDLIYLKLNNTQGIVPDDVDE